MKKIIAVTQQDIDAANQWRREHRNTISNQQCPIAQALKREYPEADEVDCGPGRLELRRGWTSLFYARSTKAVQRWMKQWDETMRAKPHRFRVDVQADQFRVEVKENQ